MSPRSDILNERLRAEATAKILASALHLFSEKGYHGASMAQIAAHAEVSKALAFHYFGTKEQLLEAIVETRLNEVMLLLGQAAQLPDARQSMRQIIAESLAHVEKHVALYRLYLTLFLQPGASDGISRIGAKLAGRFLELHALQVKLFKKLGSKCPELEAVLFRSTLQGVIVEYAMEPASYPLQQVAKRLIMKYAEEVTWMCNA